MLRHFQKFHKTVEKLVKIPVKEFNLAKLK